MSRLSRKEIKRDEMVETVGSVVDYTRSHTRTLAWGALAVVVVALVVAGVLIVNHQRAAAAAAALAAAMEVEGDEATARDRFQEVVDRYPSSAAAAVARLYLARQAARDDDPERASRLWQELAGRGDDDLLALQALLNRWELARHQGRYDELLAEIRGRLEADQPSPTADQLLYQLALTLEARGSGGEARDAYLRLVEEHPESVLRGLAQERADRLAGDVG